MIRYAPNPVHKHTYTEASPPLPRSDKTPCPRDVSAAECSALLDTSVAENEDDPRSRRYALRRSSAGLELFAAQVHSPDGQETIDFHGYPVPTAPSRVLRAFRDRGDLLPAEYNRLVRSKL